jgi:hypothetical protein
MTKLFVATPTRDSQATGASRDSLLNLVLSSPGLEILHAVEQSDEDVVRSRSRYVRQFLETDATHLLWADADVAYHPMVVHRMLASGHPFVCTPYPKKRIDWSRVESHVQRMVTRGADVDADGLEAASQEYPVRFLERTHLDPQTQTIPVAESAIGCAIQTRGCLEAMVHYYASALTFDDGRDLNKPTVALFQIRLDGRDLLSEDFSFCRRWREMRSDNEVRLYLGPGAPAAHVGPYFYPGRLSAFGPTRSA